MVLENKEVKKKKKKFVNGTQEPMTKLPMAKTI